MSRRVYATVSESALKHNLNQVKRRAPHSKIIAMVKANAYGHGLISVAEALQDVDAFGVACIDEALKIRQAGIKTDIVLIEGIFQEEELPQVQKENFIIVVHHWPQVVALKQYSGALQQPFRIWLKINTGMNRLGFFENEFAKAYQQLCYDQQIEIIGFMSHFATADHRERDFTLNQVKQFEKIVGSFKGQRCLANSAAIVAFPNTHADWIRPGLLLYGASPFAEITAKELNLKPAMTFNSEIIAIRDLKMHECVGYGITWKNTQTSCKMGIVAMGYGDGYPWHAKNGTPVLVNGERASTIGRISMDMLAVDLTHISKVKVGDPVILWGDNLPIEEVAKHASTIPWELFCRFTDRVTVHVTS
ncbi:MAG: alanine racemase [Candidatus Berkiellales bacterium]